MLPLIAQADRQKTQTGKDQTVFTSNIKHHPWFRLYLVSHRVHTKETVVANQIIESELVRNF